MSKKIDKGMVMKALEWSYEKAINGGDKFDSAEKIAKDYMEKDRSLSDNVDSLIKSHVRVATTTGFISGLPGLPAMPVTIPVNLATVAFIQIRLIAAIAIMGGYDLNNDKVKSLIFLCMAGNAAKDILKDIGIVLGKKMTMNVIKKISRETIVAINNKLQFRFLTKMGEKGLINLGKLVPIIGGIISGAADYITTKQIAMFAKKTFIYVKDE